MPGETERRVGVGLRSERGPVLLAILVSISLVALDSTVIATAVPSIVASLGGFAQFPWLFSIYLLAQAVSVPIYGKLADVFGRRPVLLAGIATFGVASILCAAAWSMPVLIAARLVQGLGAGAVQPMSVTIVGDLYSVRERARVQGYTASVWAASSIIGPALGGAFSEYVSWRWIFVVNIPLCFIAALLIARNLHESDDLPARKVDVRGAVLVATGLALAVLGILEGGEAWPWVSSAGLGIPIGGLLVLAVFVWAESRTYDPLIPLWVFRRRRLVTSNGIAACVGAVLLGLSSYVPTYAQSVLGSSPMEAGFAVATLLLGWPVASSLSGRLYLSHGFRRCAGIGAITVLLGSTVIAGLDDDSSILRVALGCLVVGLGMGLVATPTMIAAQASVGWGERGVVTAMNLFSRSLGSAVGVAVLATLANAAARSVREGGHSDLVLAASTTAFRGTVAVALVMTTIVVLMPADAGRRRGHPRPDPTN